MRIQNKGRFLFTAALLVLMLVVIAFSFQYRPGARQLPLLFAIPTAALCILMLFAERYPSLVSWFDVSLTDLVSKDSSKYKEKEEKVSTARGGAASTFFWIFGCFISIVLIGFLISVPIFTFLYTKIQWRVAWLKALAVTVLMFIVIYYGFNVLMYADLFPGILFGAIAPQL